MSLADSHQHAAQPHKDIGMQRRHFLSLMAVCFGIFGFDLLARAQNVGPASAEPTEQWQVLYLSGQRVGYGRSIVTREQRAGRTLIVSRVEEHLAIRRFGQQLKIDSLTRTEETPDGQLVSFNYEMNNPPAQSTKSSGKVNGSKLEIETIVGGRPKTSTVELDPQVKSPAYQDRFLKDNPLKPGETRAFKAFIPEFAKVADIKIIADDYRATKLHDGSERKLLKLKVEQSLVPGIGVRVYVDDKGDALRSEADLLGMVTYSVSKDIALQAIAGEELDVAVGTLVKVENPPVNLHKAKRAIYKISTPEADASQVIPTTETQTANRVSEHVVELTVVALSATKNVDSGNKKQPQYLGETSYLQSKDARVQEHANKAALGSEDAGTIATRMEKYILTELKKKNFSTALASAAEVAKSMEGDCTEHACLLAAMLRAKQIPSRVAVGLVYADKLGAFGGHMWTEAFIGGKWVPLDGTLGLGGIGPGHIKFADSDLSDDGPTPVSAFLPLLNVLSNLKIEVVKVER